MKRSKKCLGLQKVREERRINSKGEATVRSSNKEKRFGVVLGEKKIGRMKNRGKNKVLKEWKLDGEKIGITGMEEK